MSDLVTHDGTGSQPQAALGAALGRRSVVLIGMMGAGKSSVGRRLAARLGIPFVDADVEIEKAAGMTISEIFAAHGEPYFRAGETRVIARLLESGPQILATGGGAFMNADTRTTIRAKGISVWLRATLDVLSRRIRRLSTSSVARSQTEMPLARIAARVSAFMKAPPPVASTCGPPSSSRAMTRASPARK